MDRRISVHAARASLRARPLAPRLSPRLTALLSPLAQCHPTIDTAYFSALGAAVVIGDVYDPHQQRFLRAHDADVSALAVSATGRLCASGQRRSALVATGDAPVYVWDVARASVVYALFGLTEAVRHVAFSPDERFLAAAAADNTVAIWDMLSGEQVRLAAAHRAAASLTR